MPLVSVIIPTRDRRDFLGEAVASVLAQRHVELELIVVDDGSRDGTAEDIAQLGSRVRYVYQEARGVSAARNAGARLATGVWIAFLDSDDLWLPEKLERQLAFHRAHPGVDASQTDEIWVRRGVRVNRCRHHEKPSGDIFLPSLWRCLVSPSAVMMKREVYREIGGFDESLPVCEDYDLWLRLGSRHPVGLLPEPLVIKRGGHEDQLSRRFWGMDRYRVAALVKLLASETLEVERHAAAAGVLREKCAILAGGARRRGREEEALRYQALASLYEHV